MTQYSKRMVIAHWLTLLLLIAAWFFGHELDEARHEGAATLTGYVVHILVGASVLLVAFARLYFRSKDGTPPPMGQTLMDKVAKGIHVLIYLMLILIPVTGMLTTLTSKVRDALFAWDPTLLPRKFSGVIAHDVHETLVNVLIVLVVIHVLGAIKHQVIMKDGVMERMSLRRKD